MKKIAIVCNTDGALYNFRKPLIELHVNDGWEVQTFSNNFDNYFPELRKLNCTPNYVNFNKQNSLLENFRCTFSAISKIRKFNPDIIHIYTLQPIILLSIPLRIYGFDCIYSTVTGMGINFNVGNGPLTLKQKLILVILKISFYANRKIQVQNNYDYNFFIKYNVLSAGKILKVNGSGIYLKNRASDLSENKLSIYQKISFNLDPKKKIILFASRGLKEKGLFNFAEAAQIAQELNADFQFIHAGSYPEFMTKKEYEKFAKIHNFLILGYVKEISSLFKISDVIVLPSLYREGTPKSLIEAIYFNKIILTNNIPGCNETVIDGANGWLCEPGNSYDLVAKILKVSSMDNDLVRRTNNYLIKKYDVEKLYEINNKMYNLNTKNNDKL